MTAPAEKDPIELGVQHSIDFFDGFAEGYEDWAAGLHRKVADGLVTVAKPARGETALDVGTGTGLLARGFAKGVTKRGSVFAIDISLGMLEVAAERSKEFKNITFLPMPAEALVFRDGTFDLVGLCDSLTYLMDPARSLREIRRVLKEDGRLAIACHRRSLGTEAQQVFFEVLEGYAKGRFLSLPSMPAERALWGEPDVLPGILAAAGLEVVEMTQFVTGGRSETPRAWTDLMAGSGPRPHTLISVLGPRLRSEFEAELEREMARLGDDAWRYHHAFTMARARAQAQVPAQAPAPAGP